MTLDEVNDDLGLAKQPYKMNILICTHQRIKITSINIESIIGKANIILVVSEPEEAEYYSKYPVILVIHPNYPLGAKWQRGVEEAKKIGGSLMILGSDDILDPSCIDRYSVLLSEGHDFIGLSRWWQHYNGKAYLCDYLSRQPLGGARCYSNKFLQRIGYNLFNVRRNRTLDWHGWRSVKGGLILAEPLVHAIKGNWPVINKFNPNHRNVKVLEVRESKDILPYEIH